MSEPEKPDVQLGPTVAGCTVIRYWNSGLTVVYAQDEDDRWDDVVSFPFVPDRGVVLSNHLLREMRRQYRRGNRCLSRVTFSRPGPPRKS